jgi:hypothetical protein
LQTSSLFLRARKAVGLMVKSSRQMAVATDFAQDIDVRPLSRRIGSGREDPPLCKIFNAPRPWDVQVQI